MGEEATERGLVTGEGDLGHVSGLSIRQRQQQPGAELGHAAVPDHDAAIFLPGIEQKLCSFPGQPALYI
ncbi:hypothetical protein [Roseibium sp. MMSF_3544]|uniref:hypothetical protein n=1 Tax=unclassified Roseibium TaxID=2629323 RepID=UPI00273F5CED|nr:hypothetical protein [Roseibium sp. MMSF_3544]